MTESDLTCRLCADLERLGAMCYPLIQGARQQQSATGPRWVAGGRSGWPDRLIVHPWWTGLVEFKLPSGELTRLQWTVLRGLHARWKGHVLIAYHALSLRCIVNGGHKDYEWDGTAKGFLETAKLISAENLV